MPVVDFVASTEALPRRIDVAIVGGGVIGVSAALFLAERRIATLICEKGIIAGEQSSRNWGWCRTMGRCGCDLSYACHPFSAHTARHVVALLLQLRRSLKPRSHIQPEIRPHPITISTSRTYAVCNLSVRS